MERKRGRESKAPKKLYQANLIRWKTFRITLTCGHTIERKHPRLLPPRRRSVIMCHTCGAERTVKSVEDLGEENETTHK